LILSIYAFSASVEEAKQGSKTAKPKQKTNKTTKQKTNKTTKQQNNKTTKQQNNKTTKQQNRGQCALIRLSRLSPL